MQSADTGTVTSRHEAIVVGGGIAGLTAAAYLARGGLAPLLCERQSVFGGLVRTFERQGFWYDAGLRSIENSGVVMPMLRDLGLQLDWIKSTVSLGIEDRRITVESSASIDAYQDLLGHVFPGNTQEIAAIAAEIRRVTAYMDVLYGIDNPLFHNLRADTGYVMRVLLPWLVRYALTVPRIAALSDPVEDHLRRFTPNASLIDIIAQHFFQATPTSFALGYFGLYADYHYPRGGTGRLPESLAAYAEAYGARLAPGTEIVAVDPEGHTVTDAAGQVYAYRTLVWAADLNALYRSIDTEAIQSARLRQGIVERRAALAGQHGGDSVYTLYLGLDLPPEYLAGRMSAHHFYTPSREGQSSAGPLPLGRSREEILAWLDRFLGLTTYEISCPALRDSTLAPAGQSGLIVSLLFDYGLTKQIEEAGWYAEFREHVDQGMLSVLERSLFPGLSGAVVDRSSSTPLTLERLTGNTEGAITGWAFTNRTMPAENRTLAIARSVRTPLPDVFQAGQWTFSPSGLPISILTGKLAADAAQKAAARAGR